MFQHHTNLPPKHKYFPLGWESLMWATELQVKDDSQTLSVLSEGVCSSVPYIKLLPEELVVISHATIHLFLQLVDGKGRVLPVCAGRTGQ